MIVVLLLDKETQSQVGYILFDPSGMLVYRMITADTPVQAFKAIEPLLHEWFKVPLYKKYADLLAGENAVIPDDILLQEAGQCADFLNAAPEPLHLGAHRVTAAAAKANA